MKRNLQVSSRRLKTTAYQTLVRPLVEYAPSVWDPHQDIYIKRHNSSKKGAKKSSMMGNIKIQKQV